MVLKYVDLILSFSAIMLILSLVVTTLVQLIASLFCLRGHNLVWGVSRLFQQLDPSFTKEIADELSLKLLRHPAVARWGNRATQAIAKEEFVRLIKDMTVNKQVKLEDDTKVALEKYLKKEAIIAFPAPQQAALAVPLAAMAGSPAASQAVQQVSVIVQKMTQDVDQWFDTVLNRTRDVFLLHTRVITAVLALALVFTLKIDSLNLFRQLSTNDDARSRIVASVGAVSNQASEILSRPQPTPGQPAAQDTKAFENSVNTLTKLTDRMNGMPLNLRLEKWTVEENLFGMLMTVAFLCLGAPFWFNILRQTANLRPQIAQAVDPKGQK